MATIDNLDGIKVAYRPMNKEIPNLWIKHGYDKMTLPKGWVKDEGRRPLPVDMIFEKDCAITLRDGVTIYTDVFRPVDADKKPVPAILCWSIYGKSGVGKHSLDNLKYRMGVPRNKTSGLEKFEAPDPAEWIPHGYALVYPDARGTFMSEGDMAAYGTQEGRDGYDTVEWIGTQKWCNGAVGMAGNSWLGSTQWFIGAEKPPHLKALAPWEGLGDFYRESLCRGGIPDYSFWHHLLEVFVPGQNKREDIETMVDTYPTLNAYWEDKKPQLANIDVPLYALVSYSTGLHTEGSMRGFFMSSSKEKWLRIHHTQEWHDIYQPQNTGELQKFFDRYLKNENNGWEQTPCMRLSMLGYNRPSVVNRVISKYPPENFTYQTLFLDGTTRRLQYEQPSTQQVTVSYDSDVAWAMPPKSSLGFTYTLDKYTELCGWSKAELYMSTPTQNDMDVYIVIRKLDKDGHELQHFNIPFEDLPEGTTEEDIPMENIYRHIGPNGRLRASHRDVQTEPGYPEEKRQLLSDAYVWHPHDKEEKIKPGEIVKLEISLWPGGMVFDEGESMRFDIMGHHPIIPEYEGLDKSFRNLNVGKHELHTGTKYPSKLYLALSN